jgi:hypothetical protein
MHTKRNCCVLRAHIRGGYWSLYRLYAVEFAVADITEIGWNRLLLDRLAIKPERKRLIQALTTSYTSPAPDHSFDDFVAGRGRGLIMLF